MSALLHSRGGVLNLRGTGQKVANHQDVCETYIGSCAAVRLCVSDVIRSVCRPAPHSPALPTLGHRQLRVLREATLVGQERCTLGPHIGGGPAEKTEGHLSAHRASTQTSDVPCGPVACEGKACVPPGCFGDACQILRHLRLQ